MRAITRTGFDALRPLLAGEAFGQLLRFIVAGAGVTLLCVGVYLAVAIPPRVDPMIANVVSHIVGIVTGYAIHSRWTFRAEPESGPGREATMALRFAIASGVAFALNSAWVWIAVHVVHGPAWLPVPAMVFVTPLASFGLNRWWVFGRA